MRIKETTIAKSVKKTRAYRENNLTHYESVESHISYTVEDPTEANITELKDRVHYEAMKEADLDPECIREKEEK